MLLSYKKKLVKKEIRHEILAHLYFFAYKNFFVAIEKIAW